MSSGESACSVGEFPPDEPQSHSTPRVCAVASCLENCLVTPAACVLRGAAMLNEWSLIEVVLSQQPAGNETHPG